MRKRSRCTAALAAAAWLGGTGCLLAGTYSDEQMELAGRLGAAVALSRLCTGTVPTSAVVRALAAGGLSQSDVLGDTPIHQRMQKQASAVLSDSNRKRDAGLPQAEVVRSACEGYRASFGPNGVLAGGETD